MKASQHASLISNMFVVASFFAEGTLQRVMLIIIACAWLWLSWKHGKWELEESKAINDYNLALVKLEIAKREKEQKNDKKNNIKK